MRTITQSATAATVQEAAHQLLVLDYPRAVVDLPDRMRALIDQRLECGVTPLGAGRGGQIYHAAAVLVEGDDEVGSRAVIGLPDGWGEAEGPHCRRMRARGPTRPDHPRDARNARAGASSAASPGR